MKSRALKNAVNKYYQIYEENKYMLYQFSVAVFIKH